mmetsp:Transcript_35528/g.55493  ORF Transcript_35528/g.55493 Transcript_35528/m.55493 type:complete len:83 (+) Transcript_35528:578-826(+)
MAPRLQHPGHANRSASLVSDIKHWALNCTPKLENPSLLPPTQVIVLNPVTAPPIDPDGLIQASDALLQLKAQLFGYHWVPQS